MGKINLAEQIHVYPVLAPADIGATATYSNFVKIGRLGQGWLEFEVFFGAASATDSTGDVTITVVESSAGVSTDTSYALPFMYRLSAAVGSDLMGDATTSSTTGVSELATSVDNKVFLVYVDPAECTREYVGLLLTPSADSTSTIVGAVARFVPAYAQATHLTCSTT